jgi:hypothetical protein
MGDIDTPPILTLRGDLTSPVITISAPGDEQAPDEIPAKLFLMRFEDTFPENDPVTIDLRDGSIRSSSGIDRIASLQPGSTLGHFRPGFNTISLDALTWTGSGPHLIAAWKDAYS